MQSATTNPQLISIVRPCKCGVASIKFSEIHFVTPTGFSGVVMLPTILHTLKVFTAATRSARGVTFAKPRTVVHPFAGISDILVLAASLVWVEGFVARCRRDIDLTANQRSGCNDTRSNQNHNNQKMHKCILHNELQSKKGLEPKTKATQREKKYLLSCYSFQVFSLVIIAYLNILSTIFQQ